MWLVHATDLLLITIAQRCNGGALRVTGSATYKPMYFAPGLDSNPLHTPSNPRALAAGIKNGTARHRTRKGRNLFLIDLIRSGTLTREAAAPLFESPPTNTVSIIMADRNTLAADLQSVKSAPAYEFVTRPVEAVRDYMSLSEDTYVVGQTAYTHRLTYVDQGGRTHVEAE